MTRWFWIDGHWYDDYRSTDPHRSVCGMANDSKAGVSARTSPEPGKATCGECEREKDRRR